MKIFSTRIDYYRTLVLWLVNSHRSVYVLTKSMTIPYTVFIIFYFTSLFISSAIFLSSFIFASISSHVEAF